MIIYDTTYFKTAIKTLSQYKNRLESKDSLYNKQIIQVLNKIDKEKVQTRYPDIYLSIDELVANFNKEKNIDKIMNWLKDCPKQFAAAKTQLERPNILHTQLAIEISKNTYLFITNDLSNHLVETNQLTKYNETLDEAKFAVKDYLAFLNSKQINEEVE